MYGHWGEWHTGGLCTPPASSATKHALVDMQIAAFPHTRLLMNSGGKEADAFVYALQQSPHIGVRVDALCDPWFDAQFTDSPDKLALMQERWKTAPVVAEFVRPNPPNIDQCAQQVRAWHIAAIGSGSTGQWSTYTPDQQTQLLGMGKDSGYRFVLNSVTFPSSITTNSVFTLRSAWSNLGITPAYERYVVTYELRPKGTVALRWSGYSQLDLEQLLPTTTPQPLDDRLYLPDVLEPGQYTLSLVVRDLAGYRSATSRSRQARPAGVSMFPSPRRPVRSVAAAPHHHQVEAGRRA